MHSQVVTEVVEIPLKGSFGEFLPIFQLELLPVLLREEGVISVRTGVKTASSNGLTHTWAVSLTEWQSLEAHTRFVKNPSSSSFFSNLEQIARGPPTIDHYAFGSMKILGKLDNLRLTFSRGKAVRDRDASCVSAESLDNAGLFCTIGPPNDRTRADSGADVERSFDVSEYSYERKVVPHL